jgi:mRNA interferase HicA
MKRRDFERYLRLHGCVLLREGAKHSVYQNVHNGKSTTLARHTEIWSRMVQEICKQLDIPIPPNK